MKFSNLRVISPQVSGKTFDIGDFAVLPNTQKAKVIEYRWVGNRGYINQVLEVTNLDSLEIIEILASGCLFYEVNVREEVVHAIKLLGWARASDGVHGVERIRQTSPFLFDVDAEQIKEVIIDYERH